MIVLPTRGALVAALANERLARTLVSLRDSLAMLHEAGSSAEAAFIDPLRETLGAVAGQELLNFVGMKITLRNVHEIACANSFNIHTKVRLCAHR